MRVSLMRKLWRHTPAKVFNKIGVKWIIFQAERNLTYIHKLLNKKRSKT